MGFAARASCCIANTGRVKAGHYSVVTGAAFIPRIAFPLGPGQFTVLSIERFTCPVETQTLRFRSSVVSGEQDNLSRIGDFQNSLALY